MRAPLAVVTSVERIASILAFRRRIEAHRQIVVAGLALLDTAHRHPGKGHLDGFATCRMDRP